MAKGSRKRVGYDKEQSGCIGSLINIFDFRHNRPSQKLLADKKRGSRRIAGAAYPSDELNRPEDPCEICKDANAGEQCETAIIDKLKVKELMEEEMLEKHSNSDLDPRQTLLLGQQGHGRKNRWRTNKKSFDLNDVHIISEKPTHRKHKSLSSLDVTGIMAELCSQIHVKDTSEDISIPPKEDTSVTEEKLGEATKVFVSHFVEGKNTRLQPSAELMGALQVLNSNKEMFLKLLRDPNSQLVKDTEKLEDDPIYVDQNLKPQVGSDLEQGKSKHQSFFWRKFKGLDGNLSEKNRTSSKISETATRQSRFFFTELTRKLKLAMKKKGQHHLGKIDKAVGGESLGIASPSRDHFFIEKIPKSSISNKAGRLYEATSTPEQQISDIYSEAKKHLAEIVGNSDLDADLLSRQVQKSLWRILSYTDYSYSPICSPRKDGERSLVTPGKESESGNQIIPQQVPEENVNHARSANDESCVATEEIGNDLEVLKGVLNPLHSAADEIHAEGDAEITSPNDGVPKDEPNPLHSAANEIHAEADAEITGPNNGELEKRISSDTLSEPCTPSTSRDEQIEETLKDSKEEQTMFSNLDVVVANQSSSPSASSSSVCSRTEDFEDSDAITDRSERPSPISVLEPVFREDDVSPPSIKPFPVAELIQPRQIKFEDRVSPAPSARTREEERNSVLELVKAVVLSSGLTQDQLLERFLFSDHLLDLSFFDQTDQLLDHVCCDPKLLFDLIDEVVTDVCGRDFDGIPSLYKPYIWLKLKRKDIVDEIQEGVDWCLKSGHTQRTLDQTVEKDFSRSWTWMDPRLDSGSVGIEIEEEILEELIENTVINLVHTLENGVFIVT